MLFQNRMQKRKKTIDLRDNQGGRWSEDAGELASGIWMWWKINIFGKNELFPSFKFTVRNVVFFQTSSCAVERVFLKLKRIRETCGDSLYEDMTEFRVILQCNGDNCRK